MLGLILLRGLSFYCALHELSCQMQQSRFGWALRRGWSLSNLIDHFRELARFPSCFHIDINNGRRTIPLPKYSRECGSPNILLELGATRGLHIGIGEMLGELGH